LEHNLWACLKRVRRTAILWASRRCGWKSRYLLVCVFFLRPLWISSHPGTGWCMTSVSRNLYGRTSLLSSSYIGGLDQGLNAVQVTMKRLHGLLQDGGRCRCQSCHQHISSNWKEVNLGRKIELLLVYLKVVFFSIKISAYSSGPQNSIANIIREPYT